MCVCVCVCAKKSNDVHISREFHGTQLRDVHSSAHRMVFVTPSQEMDEFDTTVPGPWMEQWEIVHVNRHTEAYLEELQAGVASTPLIVG